LTTIGVENKKSIITEKDIVKIEKYFQNIN
jgi:hypothetical protein